MSGLPVVWPVGRIEVVAFATASVYSVPVDARPFTTTRVDAGVAPVWAVAVTIADSDELAVTAVSAPFDKPRTALARLDKSVLMLVMAVACVWRLVTSPLPGGQLPALGRLDLGHHGIHIDAVATQQTGGVKANPHGVFSPSLAAAAVSSVARSFAAVESPGRFRVPRLSSSCARHLQNDVLGLVQILNDYLVLDLRILMHFDDILRQFVGEGTFFAGTVSLFWQSSRNGNWSLSPGLTLRRLTTGSNPHWVP